MVIINCIELFSKQRLTFFGGTLRRCWRLFFKHSILQKYFGSRSRRHIYWPRPKQRLQNSPDLVRQKHLGSWELGQRRQASGRGVHDLQHGLSIAGRIWSANQDLRNPGWERRIDEWSWKCFFVLQSYFGFSPNFAFLLMCFNE